MHCEALTVCRRQLFVHAFGRLWCSILRGTLFLPAESVRHASFSWATNISIILIVAHLAMLTEIPVSPSVGQTRLHARYFCIALREGVEC